MPKLVENPLEVPRPVMRSRRSKASNVQYAEQSEDEEQASEIEQAESSEEEYVTRPKKQHRKRNHKLNAKEYYKELEENLQENHLFKSLGEADVAVSEESSEWIQSYKENPKVAMCDLINLLLRACGCLSQLQPHDVGDHDSVNSTVNDIQESFQNQKVHEFPFMSKSKFYKHFSKNFLEFFDHIIAFAHEGGILIEENEEETEEEEDDESLLVNILIWFASFSTSNVKAIRFVATLTLINIETDICMILNNLTKTIDVAQTQLSRIVTRIKSIYESLEDESDRKEVSKLKKNLKSNKEKLEANTKNIDALNSSRNVLELFLSEIFHTVFSHRFKDVDPKIRVECAKSLYHWIELRPEFFLENTYLKYFGWLLYDTTNIVVLEVLKSLSKLYKKNNSSVISGLKQFTEKFKDHLIDLLITDPDNNIKIACCHLLIEINRIGFLEDWEILKINNFVFKILQKDAEDVAYEFNNVPEINKLLKSNVKLLNELIRFVNFTEIEKSSELQEKFKLNISDFEKNVNDISISEIIKFKNLVKVISQSKHYEKLEDSEEFEDTLLDTYDTAVTNYCPKMIDNDITTSGLRKMLIISNEGNNKQLMDKFSALVYSNEISRIGLLLYKNFSSYFKSWKFLLKYLTIDLTSINFENSDTSTIDPEFKELLELDNVEEFFLLNLTFGILYGVLTKESINYHIDEYNGKKKRMTRKEVELKKAAELEAQERNEAKIAEAKIAKANMDENKEEENNEEENNEESNDEDEDDEVEVIESTGMIIGQIINILPSLIDKFQPSAHNLKIVLRILFDLILNINDANNNEKLLMAFQQSSEDSIIFSKMIKKLLNIFKNTGTSDNVIEDEISILRIEFYKFFHIIKNGIETNELSNEIKILIENSIIELSLEITDKLSIDDDDNLSKFQYSIKKAEKIHLSIEKLLIIGQSFEIVDNINEEIIELLGQNIFSNLLYFNEDDTDLFDENNELISIEQQQQKNEKVLKCFNSIIKLYLNFSSWKLFKLFSFGSNDSKSLLSDINLNEYKNEKPSLESYFGKIQIIIEQLSQFCTVDDNDQLMNSELLFKMKFSSSICLMDLLMAVKLFYSNFIDNKKLIRYFDDFDFYLDTQVSLELSSDLKNSFNLIFLNLEGNLAKLLDVQLMREDDEGVEYGYLKEDDISKFDDSTVEKMIFEEEKRLIQFVIKLFNLQKTELIGNDFLKRLKLNKKILGTLFDKVVSSTDSKTINEEEKSKRKSFRQIQQEKEQEEEDNEPMEEIVEDEEIVDITKRKNPPKLISTAQSTEQIQSSMDNDPILTQDSTIMLPPTQKNLHRESEEYEIISDSDTSTFQSTPRKRKKSGTSSKGSKKSKTSSKHIFPDEENSEFEVIED